MGSNSFTTRKQNLILLCVLMLALLFYRPANLPGTTSVSAQNEAGAAHYLLIMQDDAGLSKAEAINQAEEQNSPLSPAALKAARRTRVINTLQAQAKNSQQKALSQLESMRAAGKIRSARSLWVVNAISVEVPSDASQAAVMTELARLDGVARVRIDPPLVLAGGSLKNAPTYNAATVTPTQNIAQINAPLLWAMGYTGKGVVVASLDTGVSLNNSDLNGKYRKGSNYWLDVHGRYTTPTDDDGHGTATMGLMVSTNYGVAPDATWIAVKIFDNNVKTYLSDAFKGFAWVLDPDGEPTTDDGADVVNNSWSYDTLGCTEDPNVDVHAALKALIAAGVLPVFAAGNLSIGYSNPVSTDPSPSNYPEAFAVGAVDASHQIAYFSSRGPSSCRPVGQVFPDIVAPGVSITSTATTNGSVYIGSGTSFSAPQAAGVLALLLQAYPNLPVDLQRRSLRSGAMDYWGTTPDNTYGYGMLNAYTAYLHAGYMLGNPFPYRINLPIVSHQ